MKNFTNNFKQFTSRLSARWLIMALMMLVGTSSAWGANLASGQAIQFKFSQGSVSQNSGWNGTVLNMWDNNGNSEQVNVQPGDVYTISEGHWIPTKFQYLSQHDWDGWKGKTAEIGDCGRGSTLLANKMYEVTLSTTIDWAGTQHKDYPNKQFKHTLSCVAADLCKPTYYIAGTLPGALWDEGKHLEMTTCEGGLRSLTFNDVEESDYEFKITQGNWGWSTGSYHTDKGNLKCESSGGNIKISTIGLGQTNITIYFDGTKAYASYAAACTPPAAPTLNSNSTTVCSGTSFTLPSGYRWYTVETGGTILSSNIISAGVTKQTKYYAEAGEDGCVSTSRTEYTVNVDPKSALELTEANPTICQGSSIVLSNYVESSKGTVKWYSNSGMTEEITNPSVARTPQSNPTYYYARAKSGVCSSVDKTLTVTLSPQPAITLKAAPTICQGTTITFANYVNTSTGTVTWHTKSDFSDAAITSAKPSQTTTYYAKASSGDCTPATASLKVTVNDKPAVPTLSADNTSLVSPDKTTLTAGNTTNGLTYTLYNGETPGESQVSEGRDLTFKAGDAGSYTVKVTNSCGTSTSDVVTITVCTPQTNEFRHANSSYNQLANQPTYYPGDKAYFVSTIDCCLTGTWSNNLQKGEEGWWTGLTGKTPKFSMTLTRAGNFTITNMATNGCTQDKNVLVNLDFTITALSQVTNANGTASGADIALTWKHSANHTKVMVVRYPTAGTETIPAGGQSYSAGNTLGEGTVVYVGTSESYTDKNLPAGASYKYYFYTVNNNYYSDGVVLNMSSCPIPAKPILSSTAITACNGECTAQGYITINNMNDYKDDTYTFELGSSVVTPDANGRLGINSTAYTQYTVTVTNSCGNPNSANVEIAINDKTPTISGATIAQPGKLNKIELTVPAGITAKWSVSPEADFSVTEGNSTMFSAETNGTYTITATNGTCSDTHEVTVADAFYIYFRNAKKGETAYANFYDPNQNTEEVQGGEMFYAECDAYPTNGNNSLPTHFVNYNKGGRKADIITTDCDGYTWYGFKASAEVVAGTKYFYVHATNNKNYNGHYTHTVPTKKALTSDVYYTLGTTNHTPTHYGWNIEEASAPYAGPKVYALGSTTLGTDKFAALYVTDCSGKEIKSYQWYNNENVYDSKCEYVTKDGQITGDAGKTNNIRPAIAGNYSCTVTYEDGTTATSAAVEISGSYNRSFTSTIPVLVVNTGDKDFPGCQASGTDNYPSKYAEKLKAKRSVDVKIYDGKGALVYDRKARMAYRGSSSLNFTKKSYAFCPGDANCGDKDKGEDYVKTAKLNMLGVGKACDKDWVLYAAAADPSLMRNRMVFDTYQAMRPNDWGVHSRYVELIINGEYKGVYVFMDKITMNKERVKVDEDKGFIVKFDKTDCADRVEGYNGIFGDQKTFSTERTGRYGISTYHTTVDQLFEIEYPEKDDYPTGWANKVASIKGMFQAFEDALEAGDYATVQKYIDYDSWADWFIINEFTKNLDAYRASCIFVYTGEAGAKIEARPLWDQELSFNNAAAGLSGKGANSTSGLLIQNDGVYTDCFPAPFWFTGQLATFGTCGGNNGSGAKGEKLANCLLNDPCFVQVVKEKWNQHQFGALSAEELGKLITKYDDELGYTEKSGSTILKRESTKWPDDFRTSADCSAGGTGYNKVSYSDSKTAITNWISDDATKGRRAGLTTALNGLTGASFSIQIIPSEAKTTPWEPVEIAVSVTPAGYDYKLEYTDNDLGSVANTIIKEEGDKITYRIPRPSAWGAGDAEEGARADIEYGIKATLSVQEGTTVCGSQAAPSSTGKIILQDEDNDNCK